LITTLDMVHSPSSLSQLDISKKTLYLN